MSGKNLLVSPVYLCPKKPGLFWIDAVCINQDGVQERGLQVRLTKQIYQQVKAVIELLYRPPFATFADSTAWNIVQNENDRGFTKLHLRPLKMVHHPWFMLVWTLQEVIFARDIAIASQHDVKSNADITWDEALDLRFWYLDRYKCDDSNTPVEETIELLIATMMAMNDWRSENKSDVLIWFDSFQALVKHKILGHLEISSQSGCWFIRYGRLWWSKSQSRWGRLLLTR